MSSINFLLYSQAPTPDGANTNSEPLWYLSPYYAMGGEKIGSADEYNPTPTGEWTLKHHKLFVGGSSSETLVNADTYDLFFGCDQTQVSPKDNARFPHMNDPDYGRAHTGLPLRFQKVYFYGKDQTNDETNLYATYMLVSQPVLVSGDTEGLGPYYTDLEEMQSVTVDNIKDWTDTSYIAGASTPDNIQYSGKIIIGAGGTTSSSQNHSWKLYGSDGARMINSGNILWWDAAGDIWQDICVTGGAVSDKNWYYLTIALTTGEIATSYDIQQSDSKPTYSKSNLTIILGEWVDEPFNRKTEDIILPRLS